MAKEYKKKMRGAEGDKYRLDNQHQVLAVSIIPGHEDVKLFLLNSTEHKN